MTKKEERFVETVWDFYRAHKRAHLSWRKTRDPYKILLSEVMLQQTQVDRVLPKYEAFLEAFPTVGALANAPLASVLRHWQGLGYNRRAKMLHLCAKEIIVKHKGVFPKAYESLLALPGIGPYTANAVLAFAFNKPVTLIETNVRSVYLHHFFHDETDVPDARILQIIERTLQARTPRSWYYALMDYGAHIKKTYGNPNFKSKHYAAQPRFEGSDRQIRGAILRLVLKKPYTRFALHAALAQFEDARIDAQLFKLNEEGMIEKRRRVYSAP